VVKTHRSKAQIAGPNQRHTTRKYLALPLASVFPGSRLRSRPASPPERLQRNPTQRCGAWCCSKINAGIAWRLTKGEALVVVPGALVPHDGDAPVAPVLARALDVPGLSDVPLLACRAEVDRVHDRPSLLLTFLAPPRSVPLARKGRMRPSRMTHLRSESAGRSQMPPPITSPTPRFCSTAQVPQLQAARLGIFDFSSY